MISNLLVISRIILLVPLLWLLVRGGEFHYWAALIVFVVCGLGSLLDSYLPNRRTLPPFAAMLDVLADRLLTVVVVAGLMVAGIRGGLVMVAFLVLIARDVVIATLNEALPEKIEVRLSGLEKGRIVLQIIGFSFLIAPNFLLPDMLLPSRLLGSLSLVLASFLALIALADYARRAAPRLRSNRINAPPSPAPSNV